MRLSHCPWYRISNAEAHAYGYNDNCYMPNQWTKEHCVIAVPNRICEIHEPQIKRRHNVFLICSVVPYGISPPAYPVALEWGFGDAETTVQRYKLFPNRQNKSFGGRRFPPSCPRSPRDGHGPSKHVIHTQVNPHRVAQGAVGASGHLGRDDEILVPRTLDTDAEGGHGLPRHLAQVCLVLA